MIQLTTKTQERLVSVPLTFPAINYPSPVYLLPVVERLTDVAILSAPRIVRVVPCRVPFETRNSGSSAIGARLLAYAAEGDPIGAGLLAYAAEGDPIGGGLLAYARWRTCDNAMFDSIHYEQMFNYGSAAPFLGTGVNK